MVAAEWAEIRARRRLAGGRAPESVAGPPPGLAGLALSGGGIRSATFCLGLLERLHERRLLDRFDYLSTVSGGGFVGSWWSAWLAREGTGLAGSGLFPPSEKIEPEREPLYKKMGGSPAVPDGQRECEGSVHAGTDPRQADPVHHLRLFSNYLTPRKGALSADTWRAVAVLTRNLLMTWLVLVPVLIATVWLGQLYFVVHPASRDHYAVRLFTAATPAAGAAEACGPVRIPERLSTASVLAERVRAAGTVVLPLLGGVALMIVLWLVWSRDRWTATDGVLVAATSLGAAALIVLAMRFLATPGTAPAAAEEGRRWALAVVPAALLTLYVCRRPPGAATRLDGRQLRRNQIIRVHAFLLVAAVLASLALAFAGAGHVLVEYAFFSAGQQGPIGSAVARAGGWGSVLLAGAGMLYTAFIAAPTGGGEVRRETPGWMGRSMLSITPPLVVLVLGIAAAWTGHALLRRVLACPAVRLEQLLIASALGVVLLLWLAIYEFHPPQRWKAVLLAMIAMATVVAAVLAVHRYSVGRELIAHRTWRLGLAVAAAAALLFRALVRDTWKGDQTRRSLDVRFLGDRPAATRRRGLFWLAGGVGALALAAFAGLQVTLARQPAARPEVSLAVLAGFVICLVISVFELVWGRGDNARSIGLLSVAFAITAATALTGLWPTWYEPQAVVGLIGAMVAWVVALGWMADPNALSLHNFYKMRLVRAYLGASNDRREGKQITESALGDDVPLAALENCAKGGPYHLINTTLNLVGGRDLATAQRSSASFTLSKLYCGCPRTGYRPTRAYMCGTLSLGTAVAISGAAASPNQGALTPTAARALLMTLLNVRLGYWAPTPDRPYWMASQARLWPVYLLKEALSQTTDLMPYCYLTDGGHFDNTGLYALVERGCRLIVLADCGADADLSFGDLADAIRRCRIDFGVDIALDLSPVAGEVPRRHFATGTIRYSREHAARLGWSAHDASSLEGRLIVVKPVITGDEPVDIRYYRRQNATFPQQSTSDQFFSEAQFESYRRLGELSAEDASEAIARALDGAAPESIIASA